MKSHDHFYAKRMRLNFAFLIAMVALIVVAAATEPLVSEPKPVVVKTECQQ